MSAFLVHFCFISLTNLTYYIDNVTGCFTQCHKIFGIVHDG
uniref:Uncharacterized protein n=1 Tax=Arundo donax TaxID=35708 RepID=A0A0A9FME0_ARUDO